MSRFQIAKLRAIAGILCVTVFASIAAAQGITQPKQGQGGSVVVVRP